MQQTRPISKFGEIARLWRTVRHLTPVQIFGRVRFRLAKPRLDLAPAPSLAERDGVWQAPPCREPSLTGPTRFRFLNEEAELAEHGWDDPNLAKLWRYNQHYFDDLNARDTAQRHEWHKALIAEWIASNPPPVGSGWEPYPTSLRIVNWIKWALAGNTLDHSARGSLATQTRWLTKRLEWHIRGNHLFVNAKALVFAGLFFDGDEAKAWLDLGLDILRREIPEQILSDGAQFELSPMYHALALEDMLDLANVARGFGKMNLSGEFSEPVPTMLDWLALMSHPDRRIAFFNDAAWGVAPENTDLYRYAAALGFETVGAEPEQMGGGLRHSAPSGYFRMANARAVVFGDVAQVGPIYLPGHAHADTLSFELSLDGERLIVNSGTSVYGLGSERERQRGTAAHSALVIDGADSSEVWAGFRTGRRARCFDVQTEETETGMMVRGSHDGYAHLPGKPIHHREWRMEADALTVIDTVTGSGHHLLEAYFRLAPGISPQLTHDRRCELFGPDGQLLAGVTAQGVVLETIPTTWHPQFGISRDSMAIGARYEGNIPHTLEYQFQWTAR